MGENCSANSRLIVDAKIKDKLIENILNALREWPMGDPLNPENRLGDIISKQHFESINIAIEKGILEGAKLILRHDNKINQKGYFIGPVIFDNVNPEMALARDEIFGPVLAIIAVTGAEEALKVANDTSYGLAASIFTANIGKAHRMAKAIRAGTVSINCYSEGDITTPFGGYKQSGFGGRDKSLHAHDQYTELKTIWVDVSEEKLVNTME
jgi:gamma-glutamyl-gamma-aminobutyraldehyde dehydrogenase